MKALDLAVAISMILSLSANAQNSQPSLKSNEVEAIQKKIDENTAAIKNDPKNDKYYGARGQDHEILGNYAKAIEDLSKAISLNPSRQAYFNVRANCYVRLQRYKEAYEDYGKAIAVVPPTNLLYLKRGEAAVGFDDYHKGLDAAKLAVKMSPDDLDSLILLGACEDRVGLMKDSLNHLSKAIELHPKSASAFIVRAQTYTDMGKKDLALRDRQQAKRLNGAGQ